MVALTSEIVYDLKTLEIARQIPENHAELDNLHVGKPWKATCRSFPQGFMAFRHLSLQAYRRPVFGFFSRLKWVMFG